MWWEVKQHVLAEAQRAGGAGLGVWVGVYQRDGSILKCRSLPSLRMLSTFPVLKRLSANATSPRKSALVFPCFLVKLRHSASIKAVLINISLFPVYHIDSHLLENRDSVFLLSYPKGPNTKLCLQTTLSHGLLAALLNFS